MAPREIIHKLLQAGFAVKEGARHTKLTHPDGRVAVVPRHARDLPTGTLKAIAREARVPLP